MSWVRLDDGWLRHPKMRAIGKDGRALVIAGLSYASANRTDGLLPKAAVPLVAAESEVRVSVARRLVDEAVWHDVGTVCACFRDGTEPVPAGHYAIHDYLEYHPSRVQLDDGRSELSSKRAVAGRRGGIASGEARRKQPPTKSEANREPNTQANRQQIEAPVPIPEGVQVSSSSTVVRGFDPDDDGRPPIAIEALRLFARWSARNRATTSRNGYEAGVLANGHDHTPRLLAHLDAHPDATVDDLARAVFGMSEADVHATRKALS